MLRNKQHIFGLHISMSNLLKVHIVQAQHDLMYDISSLTFCEASGLCQSLEKLATFYQLGDDVIVLVVFK